MACSISFIALASVTGFLGGSQNRAKLLPMLRTRSWLTPLFFTGLLPLLWSQPQGLEPSDRDYLVSHLEFTRDLVAASTRGLSRAQWEYRPAPDRWTIAQCIDHLTKTEA